MNGIDTALFLALAAPAPAAPPVDAALANAARFCEAVVTERKTPPPVPNGAAVQSGGEVPDLVKRFAATRPMIRLFGVGSYVHFHALDGQVWVVRSSQSDVCNIVVTAVPAGLARLGASFIKSLASQGWKNRSSVTATPAKPFWRHALVKWVPKPDSPRFGMTLEVQGLLPPSGTEDGVQMELSFIGGDNLRVGGSPN